MAPSAVETSPDISVPISKLQSLAVTDSRDGVSALISALLTLKPLLSEEASIDLPEDEAYKTSAARWSDIDTPTPGAVVNVKREEDIVATIKWATAKSIPFLAQSGAHGFSSTLKKLDRSGIIINLRSINTVNIDLPAGTATLGAGTLTHEVLEAATKAKAHVMTGVCNTVGIIAALLGGGVGVQQSLYGLGVDNILSCRLVTATGEVLTVSKDENAELFWGVRGAGHNFGIVSEMTVKAYPEVNEGMHWARTLIYPGTPALAKAVTKTVQDMGIGKNMACTLLFARAPPTFQPAIIACLWYAGPEASALLAFKPLFDLDPIMKMGGMVPYVEINAPSDIAAGKGGRKPCFSVGLKQTETERVADVFTQWAVFTETHQEAGKSVIIVECYDYTKVREVKHEETAFAWRGCDVHVVASIDYISPSLDAIAEEFGQNFRKTLTSKTTYVNFAHGDEEIETVYGSKERLERLRGLKTKYDPEGVFSCYNAIV